MEELNENNDKPKLKLSLADNAGDAVGTNKETAQSSVSQDEFIGNRYTGYFQQEEGAYQGSDTYYSSVTSSTQSVGNKLGFIMGIVLWVALLIPILVFA